MRLFLRHATKVVRLGLFLEVAHLRHKVRLAILVHHGLPIFQRGRSAAHRHKLSLLGGAVAVKGTPHVEIGLRKFLALIFLLCLVYVDGAWGSQSETVRSFIGVPSRAERPRILFVTLVDVCSANFGLEVPGQFGLRNRVLIWRLQVGRLVYSSMKVGVLAKCPVLFPQFTSVNGRGSFNAHRIRLFIWRLENSVLFGE